MDFEAVCLIFVNNPKSPPLMKKLIFTLFCALMGAMVVHADDFSHTLQFSESDFTILTGTGDSLSIISLKSPAAHPDPTEPDIPILNRNVAIPGATVIDGITFSYNKRLIRSGVNIQNSANPVPTNVDPSTIVKRNIGYTPKDYPDSVCTLATTYNVGGVKIASLLVSPFVFDAATHNLYFIDSILMTMAQDGHLWLCVQCNLI